MKNGGVKKKPYPTWICWPCGDQFSRWRTDVATYHKGKCDVCGGERNVTEPRDFYYPKFPGHEERGR
jgi:hypothetical protein